MGEWERGGGWAVGKMDKATVLLSLLGVCAEAMGERWRVGCRQDGQGYSVAQPSWGKCRGRGNGLQC